VRFVNEAAMIEDRGGTCFHITRPGLRSDDTHRSEGFVAGDQIRNEGGPRFAALQILATAGIPHV
jgi:hypothetical protein